LWFGVRLYDLRPVFIYSLIEISDRYCVNSMEHALDYELYLIYGLRLVLGESNLGVEVNALADFWLLWCTIYECWVERNTVVTPRLPTTNYQPQIVRKVGVTTRILYTKFGCWVYSVKIRLDLQ